MQFTQLEEIFSEDTCIHINILSLLYKHLFYLTTTNKPTIVLIHAP